MQSIHISRTVSVPDPLRVARYEKAPEVGPKICFFSGGTALNKLSRALIKYTHNSVHLVTPFDSGGSSAKLREAFKMIAVGDLRSRLMALADQSIQGNPAIYRLFAYRFPHDLARDDLFRMLHNMARGSDPLVTAIMDPMRKLIRNHLRWFMESMPGNFDLRGASVGNLILVGGYLNNGRHIDPVIFLFSKLVEARGTVRTMVNKYRHMVAVLENGEIVVGQHMLTGKEAPPITCRVKEVYITKDRDTLERGDVEMRKKTTDFISQAEMICYPMGSFYSSVIANILPRGVGHCVSLNDCPKVYIPNAGRDPEALGMSVADCVETLITYLNRSAGRNVPVERLLNFVIVDTKSANYDPPPDIDRIRQMGITVIDAPLVTPASAPYYDSESLIGILLSLI